VDQARLDRYECRYDSTLAIPAWVVDSVVNVADYLDPTASPIVESEILLANPAETDPNRQIVSRIELTYVQRGDVESIVASPREEEQFSSDGICTQEPLAAAQNMATFFERDVTLNNTEVKGALYVGGVLTFHDSNVAQATPPPPTPPVPNDVGLLAGSINWAGSTGVLDVKPQRRVIIEDNNYHVASSTVIRASATAPATPRIDKGSSAVVQAGVPGFPVVIASEAFRKLRACSDRLAELPGSCDSGSCATHVGVTGTTYGSLSFTLTDGLANVLNIDVATLLAMGPHRIDFTTGRRPTAVRPLIINVKSAIGATVTFEAPDLQGAGTSADYVLWNFPNASRVELLAGDRFYGTILAPYADVVSDASIEGGVIARTFVINNSTLHDVRYFQGTIGWTP
jgi:choice-of-anchor A domain-containing protein